MSVISKKDAWRNASPQPVQIEGRVKWLNKERGYGMVAQKEGADIFVHISCLEKAGYQEAPEGALISCEVVKGLKGLQATKVLNLDVEDIVEMPSELAERGKERALFAGIRTRKRFEDMHVKWFNEDKGYGFLTQALSGGDIFISAKVLEEAGVKFLYSGQKVAARIKESKRGLMAVEIKAPRARLSFFRRKTD